LARVIAQARRMGSAKFWHPDRALWTQRLRAASVGRCACAQTRGRPLAHNLGVTNSIWRRLAYTPRSYRSRCGTCARGFCLCGATLLAHRL
jgi:hypothetical protein